MSKQWDRYTVNFRAQRRQKIELIITMTWMQTVHHSFTYLTLGPQLVRLFWKSAKHLGGMVQLEEVGFWEVCNMAYRPTPVLD